MRARVFHVSPMCFVAAYDPKWNPTDPNVYTYEMTVDAETPEEIFDVYNQDDRPDAKIRRSMSVGDIIYISDFYYLCQVVGFKRLEPSKFCSELLRKAYRAEEEAAKKGSLPWEQS